jgi:hypothetical protein
MQCLPKLPKISLPKMRLPKIRTGPQPSQVVPSEPVPKKTTQIDYLEKQRDEARMERNYLSKELQKMTDALVQLKQ